MAMRQGRMIVIALGGLLGAGAVTAAPEGPPPGRYTAEQAAHGAEVYAQACAMCHKADLSGDFDTPALVGRFARNWAGGDLASLAGYLHRAMPAFAPGSLSAADNVAVLAYLLQANGEAAGPRPLPEEPAALKAMRFKP